MSSVITSEAAMTLASGPAERLMMRAAAEHTDLSAACASLSNFFSRSMSSLIIVLIECYGDRDIRYPMTLNRFAVMTFFCRNRDHLQVWNCYNCAVIKMGAAAGFGSGDSMGLNFYME